MRPVDADELLKKLLPLFNYRIVERDDVKRVVDDMPTVKQKHGHWVVPYCHCSICGQTSSRQGNYCDNCGAKMDEVME